MESRVKVIMENRKVTDTKQGLWKQTWVKGEQVSEFRYSVAWSVTVLVNPNSLSLLWSEKGLGQKLQMKYDRPFEIAQKYSPTNLSSTVTFLLWHAPHSQCVSS